MQARSFVTGFIDVLLHLDYKVMDCLAEALCDLRGRLFILGVGGSAANASHAVNDFRKICGVEAYSLTDNVAELTARINDAEDGWQTWAEVWLRTSDLCPQDALLVFSVGGGQLGTSRCIMLAARYAVQSGAGLYGVVGPEGGETAKLADICVRVPALDLVTPFTEAAQAVVWHYLVLAVKELQCKSTPIARTRK